MSIAAALNPALFVRRRFRSWLQGRLPRNDTLLLTQGNIYILPTRAGLMFGCTLFVLLLASINYQLNLGFVLTFLLAGSGLVSMHLTHGTLRGLTLHLKPVGPAFAGTPAVFEVVMTSPSTARFGIGLKIVNAADATLSWSNVPAGGQAVSHVSFVPATRGLHEVPSLSAETRFPLGLFRAWTVWRPAARLLAYPTPEPGAPEPPAARPLSGGSQHSRGTDGGEVEGVRAYRRGDSLKRVAWRKSAQTLQSRGELISRDTSASLHRELWLDWSGCSGLATEARLSRLAAWTLAADRVGVDYGLRLPGFELPTGSGESQRRLCLEALALWH